jgi:hypothetical protein
MDAGQIIYICSRLILGAAASFFAIMLWSKTRDIAWMLMVIGVIASYIDTVYTILDRFGITGGMAPVVGSVPLMTIVLPAVWSIFFIAALLTMITRKFRKYRNHNKHSNIVVEDL